MSDYLRDRLKSRILDAVNTLIVCGDIKNPMLSKFASVSDLTLSKDNAYATLYVNCMEEKELYGSVTALQEAAGYIQSRLASVLQTKNTPKLKFKADTTAQNAAKMDKLIESLKIND